LPPWITRWRIKKVELPSNRNVDFRAYGAFSSKAPKFVHDVLGKIAEGKGDQSRERVSQRGAHIHGYGAVGEAAILAQSIPVWDENLCIQCGKCVMVCPTRCDPRQGLRLQSGAIRPPMTLKWSKPKWRGMEQQR